ncbi:MAG: protein phosphatase 2C domain-containing protein [Gammaproteobacteria bacterium]|nr:protein phosphatase 2C domain-containing protein [Gammaproteobacteria bacterium]
MKFDFAQASLVGDRADNQDRAEMLIQDGVTLAILADGMGGHADGALAAETAMASLKESFRRVRKRNLDPEPFLRASLTAAHHEVLALGKGMEAQLKPGTIIVCALLIGNSMWWAHAGDSRAYHLRNGKLLERTRDHTEVDMLLAEGKITRDEVSRHRDRHIVEYCLGVAPADKPEVAIDDARTLEQGDVVILCSDGLWDQVDETTLIGQMSSPGDLNDLLLDLVHLAAQTFSPHSDNVTAIAIRASGSGRKTA